MGGFRAKDADRDRCVEVIEAAYADGQLGDADRELRVSRALTAETLDELQTLTRDLQDHPAPAEPAGPRVDIASAAVPRAAKLVFGGVFAVIIVVALLIFGVVGLAFFSGGDQDWGPGSVESSSWAVPDPVEEAQVAARPSFEMAAPEVRRFVGAYERRFGTLDAWEVAFYPTRVGVQVPVRGSRPRMERWTWDGRWRKDTDAAAVIGPRGVLDLGTVDVGRLFDNIARARKSLHVQRGRLTHVLVNDWGEGPNVNIYIGNCFDETGFLRTTPSGDVVRAYPYRS
jgi:hypothetical protein